MLHCPFGEEVFIWYGRLGYHLIHNHTEKETGLHAPGGSDYWRRESAIKCWCGQVFNVNPGFGMAHSPFASHLQQHKGAVAHLLALKMGVE
jgi:hypothetical protein